MHGRSISRLAIGMATVLCTAGFLGAGSASATVANNGVNVAYANVDGTGCQVVVGDQADPVYGSAIGEVDVTRCSRYYGLVIRVYLDHYYVNPNGTHSPLTTVAEIQLPSSGYVYGYQLDAATSRVCGYHNAQYTDYWYTVADVSFNGGQTWTGLLWSKGGYWETWC